MQQRPQRAVGEADIERAVFRFGEIDRGIGRAIGALLPRLGSAVPARFPLQPNQSVPGRRASASATASPPARGPRSEGSGTRLETITRRATSSSLRRSEPENAQRYRFAARYPVTSP